MQTANIQLALPGIGARETIHYLSLCRKTAPENRRPLEKWREKMRIAHQIFEVSVIGVMILAFVTLAIG
jgi:hypothetical protein